LRQGQHRKRQDLFRVEKQIKSDKTGENLHSKGNNEAAATPVLVARFARCGLEDVASRPSRMPRMQGGCA